MLVPVLVVVCLWTVCIVAGRHQLKVNNIANVAMVGGVLAAMTVVSIAGESSQVDRPVYVKSFRILDQVASPAVAATREGDPLFNLFLWGLARVAPPTEAVLYTVVTLIVIAGFVVATRLLLPPWAALAALVTVVAMGILTAYASVAIRQGLAIACLVVAVALVCTKGALRALIPLLIAAPLLHWTAGPMALGLLALRWRTPGVQAQLVGWTALAIGFILGAPQAILGFLGISVPNVEMYTSVESFKTYGSAGFRLDFLAVSAAILAVAVLGHRLLPGDERYTRLTAAYVMFNGAFLALGFVAYSDRIAAYSWFLAPLILWFPLAHRECRSSLPAFGVAAVLVAGLALGTLPALVA